MIVGTYLRLVLRNCHQFRTLSFVTSSAHNQQGNGGGWIRTLASVLSIRECNVNQEGNVDSWIRTVDH
jgi:hypothetical protein